MEWNILKKEVNFFGLIVQYVRFAQPPREGPVLALKLGG